MDAALEYLRVPEFGPPLSLASLLTHTDAECCGLVKAIAMLGESESGIDVGVRFKLEGSFEVAKVPDFVSATGIVFPSSISCVKDAFGEEGSDMLAHTLRIYDEFAELFCVAGILTGGGFLGETALESAPVDLSDVHTLLLDDCFQALVEKHTRGWIVYERPDRNILDTAITALIDKIDRGAFEIYGVIACCRFLRFLLVRYAERVDDERDELEELAAFFQAYVDRAADCFFTTTSSSPFGNIIDLLVRTKTCINGFEPGKPSSDSDEDVLEARRLVCPVHAVCIEREDGAYSLVTDEGGHNINSTVHLREYIINGVLPDTAVDVKDSSALVGDLLRGNIGIVWGADVPPLKRVHEEYYPERFVLFMNNGAYSKGQVRLLTKSGDYGIVQLETDTLVVVAPCAIVAAASLTDPNVLRWRGELVLFGGSEIAYAGEENAVCSTITANKGDTVYDEQGGELLYVGWDPLRAVHTAATSSGVVSEHHSISRGKIGSPR
jgi:hypothetical protein